jgi:hypothetical protein
MAEPHTLTVRCRRAIEEGEHREDTDIRSVEFELFEIQIQDDPMQAEMLDL